VPFQLVATNVGQPRSEALFEIAPSSFGQNSWNGTSVRRLMALRTADL
jgi:hypothetical protein